MPNSYFVTWVPLACATALGTGIACGQNYPSKPIRIFSADAGGNADFNARLFAQGLTSSLGQSVIVENRRGPILAAQAVAKAPPDGYTLYAIGSSFWVGTLLQEMPYDPVKDFAPITLATMSPLLIVVHPSLPAKSVKDLIALAKARPGELNYASAAAGSGNHLAAELFKNMAGVNIVRVPYGGGGPAIIDLMGGQVQVMFGTAGAVAPHIKSGRLRALAVTSAQPSALSPGLPTVAAAGVPGYVAASTNSVFAPAGTSAAIINRLNQEIVQVINKADVKEKLLNVGIEIVGSSPEQLAAAMKSELTSLGKMIRDTGIKVQ